MIKTVEINYKGGQNSGKIPKIKKIGALCYGCEQTPIIYKNKILLCRTIAKNSPDNKENDIYFQFFDTKNRPYSEPFAFGYYFSSAYCENNTVYVFGTSRAEDDDIVNDYTAGGNTVRMFYSTDLKTWKEKDIIKIPKWRLWNTSVCKADNGYYMAIEVKYKNNFRDPAVGRAFTSFFAYSENLFDWKMLPEENCYTRERYNACPALRFYDGYFYMICLEAFPLYRYAPYIYRTKDFSEWEIGLHNPVMMWDDNDRLVKKGIVLPEKQLEILRNRININCSDIDLCEYRGKTHIFYCNGDQLTYSFICEAIYDGSEKEFLQAFFK